MFQVLLACVTIGCTTTDDTVDDLDEPVGQTEPGSDPDPIETPAGETLAQINERLLSDWQRCMELDDFQVAKLAPTWAQHPAATGHQCKSCHQNGGGGFIATEDAGYMFGVLQQERYQLLQFFTVDLTVPAEAKVVINEQSFRGVASGVVPHAEHPTFQFDNTAGLNATKQFYDLTNARLVGCATPPAPL